MADLISCSVTEKDVNEDIMWVWSYPSISKKDKEYLLNKCNFMNLPAQSLYGRIENRWFYVYKSDVPDISPLPLVNQVSIIIIAKDFSPEKYNKLAVFLNKSYITQGSPNSLLLVCLKLLTKDGLTIKENGTFPIDFSSSVPTVTYVKDLIRTFDLEIILIYTAVLLKKRLIVYHHHLHNLLKLMPSFPMLVSHRDPSEILYPWFDINQDDNSVLLEGKSFILGTNNSSILSRVDLYDILVNVPAVEISTSPAAKESFVMTKIHKEIALFMVQMAQNDVSESNIVAAIAEKTQALINRIRSVSVDPNRNKITVQELKDKNLSPATENFLLQLATVENLLTPL